MPNALQVDMMASGVVDGSGVPLAGGKVYTYAAGTTTDKAVYTDAAMGTPEANPVILNAAGVKNVYAYGNYKFVIKDANDVTIRTLDNQYYAVPSTTAEVVNSIAFADSPYSATAENQLIKVNTTAGAVTIYLPTAVGNEGIEIVVVKTSSDANAVTLDSNTLFIQDINGASTAVLGTDQYSFLGTMSDNANWFISQNVNTATVTASSTTNMTNKTLTAPVLSGTVTGTYTIGGTPTVSANLIMSANAIIKSAADSALYVAGGNAGTSGGYIVLFGQSHATTANRVSYIGTHKFYDASGNADRGITVEEWTDESAGADFTATTQISYMKDPMGFVHLKGNGTGTGSGTTLFTLGAGYRPEQASKYMNGYYAYSAAANTSTISYIAIGTDGTVVPESGSTGWFLDGITFKAA